MAWLAVAAAVVSVVGDMKAGAAAKRQGLEEQNAANYAAEQQRINAEQAVAAGQRAAEEQRRQGEYVQSRAIALMAANGGGVSDIGNVQLLARNAGETAYRASVALYEGEDRSRTLNAQADASVMSGRSAAQGGRDRQSASMYRAFGDILQGGGSLYSNYSGGGVTQAPAPVTDKSTTFGGF